jgi:hypothetical protein
MVAAVTWTKSLIDVQVTGSTERPYEVQPPRGIAGSPSGTARGIR